MSNQSGFLALLSTRETADLGPGPREGVESEAALNSKVRQLSANTNIRAEQSELVRALVLLWHDHLDAAHTLAQGVENADGAFIHGIMHRREPDYGNAAYWFRRVGRHGAFVELARRASDHLNAPSDQGLKQQLINQGHWDPFGFIDACQSAVGSKSDSQQARLRELQHLEFEVLLNWLVAA